METKEYHYSVGNTNGGYRIICEVDRQHMYYHFKSFATRQEAVKALSSIKKLKKAPNLNQHWTYLTSTI